MTDERTRWRFHGTRHRNLGDQSFVSEFVLNIVSRVLVRWCAKTNGKKADREPNRFRCDNGVTPPPVRAPKRTRVGRGTGFPRWVPFRTLRVHQIKNSSVPPAKKKKIPRNIANIKLFLKNTVRYPSILRRCLRTFFSSSFGSFLQTRLDSIYFTSTTHSALRTTKTKCGFSNAFSLCLLTTCWRPRISLEAIGAGN